MSTTVTKHGLTAGNLTLGDGGVSNWNTPGNALSSNNLYAYTAFEGGSGFSNYLYISNFEFGIPDTAVIEGIEAFVERQATGSTVKDYYIGLTYGTDQITAPGKQKAATWPTGDEIASYGGATDIWNRIWTAAEINAADFGFAVSVSGDPAEGDGAVVDDVYLTLHYHNEFNEIPVGGLNCGGISEEDATYEVLASSGVICGSRAYFTDTEPASGGSTMSGDAIHVQFVPFTGGSLVGGISIRGIITTRTASGGSTVGGLATVTLNDDIDEDAIAGAIMGGEADVSHAFGPLGGIVQGGEAIVFVTYNEAPTLDIQTGGTAFVDPFLPRGGALTSAESIVDAIYNIPATGGGLASGAATEYLEFSLLGGASTGGTADLSVTLAITLEFGGSLVSGEAKVTPFIIYPEGGAVVKPHSVVFPYVVEEGGVVASGLADVTTSLTPSLSENEFSFYITGGKAVPPDLDATAFGLASVRVDATENIIYWTIEHNVTGLDKIQFRGPATRTSGGPVVILIEPPQSLESPVIGSQAITADQVVEVLSDQWYVTLPDLDNDDRMRGHIANEPTYVTGEAYVSHVPAVDILGGVLTSGEAIVDITCNTAMIGGGLVGGDTRAYLEVPAFGGLSTAGSATVIAISNIEVLTGTLNAAGSSLDAIIYVPPIVTTGAIVTGISPVGIEPYITAAGCVGGGAIDDPLVMYIPPISGGAATSGSYILQQTYAAQDIDGGLIGTGQSLPTYLRWYEKRRIGYGRAMASQNILTVQPDDPNRLINPLEDTSPVLSASSLRGRHQPGWCDITETCSGAVLPKIVQRRQGEHLPPKAGRTNGGSRQIATYTVQQSD